MWSHLSGIDLPDLDGSEVMLLVGSDMAHLLIHLEVHQRRVDEPITIKIPLGWTLFGNASKGLYETINANLLATIEGLPLQQQIERFGEVDSYATKQDPSEATLSIEDQRALAVLQSTTVAMERGANHAKQPCYGSTFQNSTRPKGSSRRIQNWW